MADTPLKIPPAPGSTSPDPTEEDLDNMSLEQLKTLQKQRWGGQIAPQPPDYWANAPTQAKAGAKEGAAGLLGAPAWLANMATAGGEGVTGSLGYGKFPADPAQVREATAPYSTEAILQGKSKIPFTGRLALTPEQQQPPQNFGEHLARGGAANVVGTLPLALGGPQAMAAALGRSAAATGLGEGLGWFGDKYFPEIAPWLRAGGTFLGYGAPGGIPGGFTAASRAERAARAPAAQILESAKQPVSAAERTGSRATAFLEQKGSARPDIPQLRNEKLDTTMNGNQLHGDLNQISIDAQNAGASRQQVQYVNNQIARATDPKKGLIGKKGMMDGEDYFKLSRQWEDSKNPHVNKLGQVLDQHMGTQSDVWKANRPNLSHVPDLATLEQASKKASFPEPYDPGKTMAMVGGAIPLIHASHGGMGWPAAEALSLYGLWNAPHVAQQLMKPVSALARSAPGQAWLGGWPTNQAATYATLLAGPGKRLSQDIWDPSQEVK